MASVVVCGALTVLLATRLVSVRRDVIGVAGAPAATPVSLRVMPFDTTGTAPTDWDATVFAEALASSLSDSLGIRAASGPTDRPAAFELRGAVSVAEGRIRVSARLLDAASRDTLWSSTFFRNADIGVKLIPDLASAVATAVQDAARRPERIRSRGTVQ